MSKLIVSHKTADFDKWKLAFESLNPVRKKYGNLGSTVYRGLSDPNDLVIISQWGDADSARRYSQSPELKEAMQNGAVIGESKFYFVE